MMRSMFSGVSSLRVHQTRMDVIANNIANVNTDGFKSQRATFTDSFYQNLRGATGPDPTFGRAGTNSQQVGLGLRLSSIDNLMHQGIARRTDQPLDIAIEGEGFFITRDRGGANLFTRAGTVRRDAHWNLHINGNNLMGWSTIRCSNTPGGWAVERGALQPLSLVGEKQAMPSEPTTQINMVGNLNRSQLSECPNTGMQYVILPKTIYDSLGHRYTISMRFTYHPEISEAAGSPNGYWTMEAMGGYYVLDDDGRWSNTTGTPAVPVTSDTADAVRLVHARMEGARPNDPPALISFCFLGESRGGAPFGGTSVAGFASQAHTAVTVAFDSIGNFLGMGHVNRDGDGNIIYETGGWPTPQAFNYDLAGVNAATADIAGRTFWRERSVSGMAVMPVQGVAPSATFGDTEGQASRYADTPSEPAGGYAVGDTLIRPGEFTFNFVELMQRGQANTSAVALTWDGGGPGFLEEISIGDDGTIMGRFCNGRDRILGQIPLAFFTNPAGLDRVGNSFWRQTANSGPFDGVGRIGTMIGGALEGSNVDLANEFTDMITTQRGFQAASRTITVSDEMLQELVNLRR